MIIKYINHQGKELILNRPPFFLDTTELKTYKWDYDMQVSKKRNKIVSFYKTLEERTFRFGCVSTEKKTRNEALQEFFEVIEVDILKMNPGIIQVGDWHTKAFIVSSEKIKNLNSSIISDGEISIVFENSVWQKKEVTKFFESKSTESTGNSKKYPYHYNYKYGPDVNRSGIITNTHYDSAEFLMTINGYCEYPIINIGQNVYRFNLIINKGEYLQIDSKEKTIILTNTFGFRENRFAARDVEFYSFEKIKPGMHNVFWNNNFTFELILNIERSELPWI